MPASSERTIENLISKYTFLVDEGDFEGLGELLDQCDFSLGGGMPVRGRKAIVELARRAIRTYDDSTPRARHVTSNLLIEVDEVAGKAEARAYYTVLQAADGFPLQTIACGSYRNGFERSNGEWIFTRRHVENRPEGDTSRHRRI